MVEINGELKEGVYHIGVAGDVDASSSIALDEELGRAVNDQKKIVVDLSGLEYISSAGLGVFMSYISDLESNQAKMALFGMKEKVFQVFQILGLDELLKIVPDESEAIKEVNDL